MIDVEYYRRASTRDLECIVGSTLWDEACSLATESTKYSMMKQSPALPPTCIYRTKFVGMRLLGDNDIV